jgi:hypothetical protein
VLGDDVLEAGHQWEKSESALVVTCFPMYGCVMRSEDCCYGVFVPPMLKPRIRGVRNVLLRGPSLRLCQP